MGKSFEDALGDLIAEYAGRSTTHEEMVSAMELQIMAINEETSDD